MKLEKMTEEQLLESIENIENEKERLDSNLFLYETALSDIRKATYTGRFFRHRYNLYDTYLWVLAEADGGFSSGYMENTRVEFRLSHIDKSIVAASIRTDAIDCIHREWIEITREEFIEARDRAISFITSQVT